MDKIRIFCKNTGEFHHVEAGSSLLELGREFCSGSGILAALVDNQLKELDFKVMMPVRIEFIDYGHPDGRRTFVRSLCFVLQNTVRALYPDGELIIDYSLPSGLYCEIRPLGWEEAGKPQAIHIGHEDIKRIKEEMERLIDANLPFRKVKMRQDEALKLFEGNGQRDKVRLLKSLGRFYHSVYFLDGQADTFYGPLVSSTGCLKPFDLVEFKDGFCIQYPMEGNMSELMPLKKQAKIAATLKAHSDWCSIIGIKGVGTLNKAIQQGEAVKLIQLCEAYHERQYAAIADKIYERKDKAKIVFIAGPSSSGKTSTSKRIALQCLVLGMNPKVIELDNYFVDRENTPKDEHGDYDFESLHAMDLDTLNQQLNDLLAGKTVEIPRFNFKEGRRYFNGDFMHLEPNDILIMEGIHALNPEMTAAVDDSKIFRVYASALTSLSIDENNNISTSDNRLLRRMIRDNRTRGINPENTILRWHSVRRGENKNIFPFQENADAYFNSALLFELPALKYYAEPLLRRITPNSPAYTEATRLLKFLGYIDALSPEEIATIPPTSIMREFIGGQTL
ncbi:MAG: nucleoside kinase [Candidatus Cryptobacteroides sp.]